MSADILQEVTQNDYKYGFTTDIETDIIPIGLSEDVVRLISQKKNEPEWMLEFRLKAYRYWITMKMPEWAHLNIPEIDYQSIAYYAAPRKNAPKSLDEVDPELLKTFEKLGIPLHERLILSGVAVDAVMDSVSVKTTFKEALSEKGIIFCSFSEAVQEHPDLVKKYMASVVPYTDNFFATLNSAVFTDGSFCYIPKGVRCPVELSTYFRINFVQTFRSVFARCSIIGNALVINFGNIEMSPFRHFHGQPVTVSFQSEFKHPFRFIFFGRNKSDNILAESNWNNIGFNIGGKSVFIITLGDLFYNSF